MPRFPGPGNESVSTPCEGTSKTLISGPVIKKCQGNNRGIEELPTSVEIAHAGEKIVVDVLKSRGFVIDRWDDRAPGPAEIEAHGPPKVLVQVRAAISPHVPPALSDSDEEEVKSRAVHTGAKAFEAKVSLTPFLTLKYDIHWRELT